MSATPKKHKNIPIFIPHAGCPHRCVFCDQRTISGRVGFDESAVASEIEAALDTLPPDAEAEIAYFGGSFTAIDRTLMIRLLDLAQTYVDGGRVSGIRFSTRPDAVGDEVLELLAPYRIRAIELGLQSLDDTVLSLCERGHTAAQAEEACRRIVTRGYSLVGQMMLGLPASDTQKELFTARRICDLGASAARIYPTVVLDGTPLADLMRAGAYRPLSNEQAAVRAAKLLQIFHERGVKVLRVGLSACEELSSPCVLGGASHPAMGELAYAALFRLRMERLLLERTDVAGRTAVFCVARGKTSQALGQHRANAKSLIEQFSLARLRVVESDSCRDMQVSLCSLA